MKISELGERKLITRLNSLVEIETDDHLAKYDDAFYFESSTLGDLVIHADMLVAKTDVPKQMEFFQVGVKSVIMNLSDLVVKGIEPKGMIVVLGLSSTMDVQDFDDLLGGIGKTAARYNVKYIGGDINEADDLVVSITVFGFHREGRIVPRKGIQPGQIVATTGQFGFNAVGLKLLLHDASQDKLDRYQSCCDAVIRPTLNYEAMLDVAHQDGVVASIDSSDGLSASLVDLMDMNECGFLIDSLPVDPLVEQFSQEFETDLTDLLFFGGEEYHAIFVIDDQAWPEIHAYAMDHGHYLERIGITIPEKEIIYEDASRGITQHITRRGFEHFGQVSY